jgi:hypothetical protein
MDCALPQASPSLDVTALTNGAARRYEIKAVMNVTMPKLVLGDPLAMPIIDAHANHVRRCFDGASLSSLSLPLTHTHTYTHCFVASEVEGGLRDGPRVLLTLSLSMSWV